MDASEAGRHGRESRLARRTAHLLAALCTAGALAAIPAPGPAAEPTAGQEIQFRHAVDDQPLDLPPRPGEQLTEAVKQFRRTGVNPYAGDEGALAEGKKLYAQWCQSCHLPDGSGRMGPSLIDEEYYYPRVPTDIGLFEIIYGGATGAMQPFGRRMTQDQILKLMVYVRSLKK